MEDIREEKLASNTISGGQYARLKWTINKIRNSKIGDMKIQDITKDDIQLYFYDNLFDELLKENSYVDLIIVLHYILARVKWNKYKDEYGNNIENKYGYLKESIYNNLEIINAEPIELW